MSGLPIFYDVLNNTKFAKSQSLSVKESLKRGYQAAVFELSRVGVCGWVGESAFV